MREGVRRCVKLGIFGKDGQIVTGDLSGNLSNELLICHQHSAAFFAQPIGDETPTACRPTSVASSSGLDARAGTRIPVAPMRFVVLSSSR